MNVTSILKYLEHNARILQGKGFTSLPMETKTAADFLKTNYSGRPLNVFDCGANIGNWTTSLIEELDEIDLDTVTNFYLFEPQMINYDTLTAKFKANSNVHVEGLGVSNSTRQSTMYTDGAGSGMGSLYQRTLYDKIEFTHKEVVSLITLDEFIEKQGITAIDYLKLDLEGHEMDALEGCISSIERKVVGAIQFEFGAPNLESRTFFRDYYRFFKNNDFTLFRITPLQVYPIDSYQETDECFVNACNYVAVSPQKNLGTHSYRQFWKLLKYFGYKMGLYKIDFG